MLFVNYTYLFSSYFKRYVFTKNEIKSQKEIWRQFILSVAPLTGLVETFSVGLVETCFNYPLATLYAIIDFGTDRNHT